MATNDLPTAARAVVIGAGIAGNSMVYHLARLGWRDLVNFVASDVVHPPLFYAVLKLWIGVGGESLLWL